MIKVSVILPVYNVEKYIRKCLESLIRQELKEIEIIVVNDGSTDKSLDIINEFMKLDNRIKLVNKNNSGVSAARNSGLMIANGEYVSFVDSDDWVEKSFLFKLYNLAKANSCDVAGCNFVISGENSKVEYKYPLDEEKIYERQDITSDIAEKIIAGTIKTNVWDKIYKREFLSTNSIKFDEKIIRFEDWYFYVEVCKHMNRCIYINEGLYNYRIIEGSLSNKYYENFFEMIINMNKRKQLFINELSIRDERNYRNMRNNFIDDIIKSINHIIFESNKSLRYKIMKIREVLNSEYNTNLLSDNFICNYLNDREINKYYAKILLKLIDMKKPVGIYGFIKIYKLIRG